MTRRRVTGRVAGGADAVRLDGGPVTAGEPRSGGVVADGHDALSAFPCRLSGFFWADRSNGLLPPRCGSASMSFGRSCPAENALSAATYRPPTQWSQR